MVSSTSIYHDWITLNGGWRLSFNFGWGPVRMESKIMQNYGPHTQGGVEAMHYDRVQWHLPLNTMPKVVGRKAKFYDDWIAHPDYDDYWKPLSVEEHFDKITIPVHTFGGWFDIFSQGTLRGYVGMAQKGGSEQARKMSRLIIGPWGHGSSQKFGALDFGPHAHVDTNAIQLRWYDYFLKGIDNGFTSDAPVKLYRHGPQRVGRRTRISARAHAVSSDVFRERRQGQRRSRRRAAHVGEAGRQARGTAASSARGGRTRAARTERTAAMDRFRYDPDDPVPSLGGNNCCGTPTPAGPMDQRPIEGRRDILIYTSDYLDEEIEVTGPVKVVLHASSDAVDTDFVAKLVDVYPDGSTYNMAEGILRARYRDGTGTPKLLTPGEVYKMEIDMVGTSVAFRKGHRIRVHVTSSHFPQFDRNPNTGAKFGTTSEVKVANQTIYHDAARPSHILLPVIPPRRMTEPQRPPPPKQPHPRQHPPLPRDDQRGRPRPGRCVYARRVRDPEEGSRTDGDGRQVGDRLRRPLALLPPQLDGILRLRDQAGGNPHVRRIG